MGEGNVRMVGEREIKRMEAHAQRNIGLITAVVLFFVGIYGKLVNVG